ERERNGNRALAAALFLRLGEDDSIWLPLVVGHWGLMRSLPDRRRDGADRDLDQEGRKQRKQIKNREGEQFSRRAQRLGFCAAAIDIDRERQHAGAEDQGSDAVDGDEI